MLKQGEQSSDGLTFDRTYSWCQPVSHPTGLIQCFPHSHTQLLPSKILLCSFPSNATSLFFLFKIRCIPYRGYFSFPVLVFSCPMRVLQTNLGPLQEQYVLILLNCASSSVLLPYLLYIPNILPISFPFIVAEFNIWDKIYSICFCEISLFQLTR